MELFLALDRQGMRYDNWLPSRGAIHRVPVKFKLILLAAVLSPSLVLAQLPASRLIYVGAQGGLATLSGDGSAAVTPSSASSSLFDPKNGGAGQAFAGIHLFEFVSFEVDYAWNRNGVAFISTSTAPSASALQAPARITQNAFLANVSVYFRKRDSRVRPYLSEGAGAVLIQSRLSSGPIVLGSPVLPPAKSDHVSIALRTLVGIDVRTRARWYFRYTFGETLTRNTFGDQVSPALRRIPKNFQNLFGVYYKF
jgi:hypothetical protein